MPVRLVHHAPAAGAAASAVRDGAAAERGGPRALTIRLAKPTVEHAYGVALSSEGSDGACIVNELDPEGIAAEQLQLGDKILSANGSPATGAVAISRVMRGATALTLEVLRSLSTRPRSPTLEGYARAVAECKPSNRFGDAQPQPCRASDILRPR